MALLKKYPAFSRAWVFRQALKFGQFMSALDRALPPMLRAPQVRTETIERPVRRHFRTNDEESDRLKRALEHELTLVRNDLPSPSQDPRLFYQGLDTGWGCVRQKLDSWRAVAEDLTYELMAEVESQAKGPRFYVLKGAGGSGKTVALKRVAWDVATSLDQVVLWLSNTGRPDVELISELLGLTGKRVFLFVDRAAAKAYDLAQLL
jgi:hypothetical protein